MIYRITELGIVRRKQTLLEFVIISSFFLLLALYLYWGARIDYPRGDHPGYMAERSFFDSKSDWFWHSVSFTRTRLISPGDYFGFRPGLGAMLAIQDILFRGNLFATGIASIILFGGLSTAFYYTCRLFAGIAFSFIMTLIFATLPINQEIVCWRHISPYIFSLLFSAIAFSVMNKTARVFHFRWILFFALLFFSTLFNELIVVSIGLYLLLLYIIHRRHHGNSGTSNFIKPLFLWSAIAFTAFLIINLLDFWAHTPLSFLGPADRLDLWVVKHLPFVLYSVFSATVRAAILAFSIDFYVHDSILMWDFLIKGATYINAFAFLIGITILFLSALRLCSKRQLSIFSNADFFLLFSISVIISTIFLLIFGRASLRSIGYLGRTTYYWAITSFCWLYLFAYNLWAILIKLKNFPKRGETVIALFSIVLFVAGLQISKLKSNVSRFYDFHKAKRYQHNLKNISAFLSSNKPLCLSGINPDLNKEIQNIVPLIHLTEFMCKNQMNLMPQNRLFLDINRDGDLLLSKIDNLPYTSDMGIPLSMNFSATGRFRNDEDKIVSVNPSDKVYEGTGFLLSENLYANPEISVDVTNPTHAGLVINYSGPDNFDLFYVVGALVNAWVMENGQVSLHPPVPIAYVPEKLNLSIGNSRTRTYFLIDGIPYISLSKQISKRGKCGIFSGIIGRRNQIFSIPIVLDSERRNENKFVFKPLFNVSSGSFIRNVSFN